MSERFTIAIQCLKSWQSQHPQDSETQRELQIAMDILRGRRPGLEQKYDALLLKLDREYSRMEDRRDHWAGVAAESPLFHTRQYAKAQAKTLTRLLQDLKWMRGANRDMAELAKAAV